MHRGPDADRVAHFPALTVAVQRIRPPRKRLVELEVGVEFTGSSGRAASARWPPAQTDSPSAIATSALAQAGAFM